MAFSGSGGAWYKTGAVSPSSSFPTVTMHFFFKTAANASTANFRGMAHLRANSNTTPASDQICWNHTNGSYNKAYNHAPDFSVAKLTSTPALDTWHSLAARNDGTNIKIYLNGTEEASAARGSAGTDHPRYIGILGLMTEAGVLDVTSQWSDGTIAEFAIWQAALDADEIVSLSKGFRAPLVRRASIYGYWPLLRELFELRQAFPMLNQTGSDVVADHPRVFG